MKRSGQADLPLHYGRVPAWLYERMAVLGRAIVEVIVSEYGSAEFLRRMSDPFWFQSLGSVMGMDWHSSGITTSVMGSLKQAINPLSKELGLYICGGRGKYSRQTPDEILKVASTTGINGNALVRCSKLTAKVDNNAIQDGFQLYLHSFILNKEGEWAVIQQGMNTDNRLARRYHWHSPGITSFVEEPHTSICGKNVGTIMNLTDKKARSTRKGIINVSKDNPENTISEVKKLILSSHHSITFHDVDVKRLGSVLAMAYDRQFKQFEELLLIKGLGPKTLRSLTLVSEVIHGTPSRFKDPARFAFAQGGKDGHPFPVQLNPYDETIQFLKNAIEMAKIGYHDKKRALKKIVSLLIKLEKGFTPDIHHFNTYITQERLDSKYYKGKTIFDKPSNQKKDDGQLRMF